MCLKVLVWGHCFLSNTLVNSLKLQVFIFLMFMFDTQLYISFSSNDIGEQLHTLPAIEDCVAAIRSWMSEDKLNLYDDKTEFLLVGTKQQLAKVCIKDIKVGCVEISPSSSVRNLGAWFDSSLNVSEHITKLCASAFFYILQHKAY